MHLSFHLILLLVDPSVVGVSGEIEFSQKELSMEAHLDESGCVCTLLYNSQSCEYKTLRKHVREALSSGKFIPSNIVSMMNAIIAWQPLTIEQLSHLRYEANKNIDCYMFSVMNLNPYFLKLRYTSIFHHGLKILHYCYLYINEMTY